MQESKHRPLTVKLLLVCVGNICRSPIAAAMFAAASNDQVSYETRSCGIGAMAGSPADKDAKQLGEAAGLDLEAHMSRQIDDEDVAWADMIFVMDTEQHLYIEKNFPAASSKTFRLGELDDHEIEDPYGEDLAAHETAVKAIRSGVDGWHQKISAS